MEICNTLFIQKENYVEAHFSSSKNQSFVQNILSANKIKFSNQGFGKAILESDDYYGFITITKVRIESSIETINKLLTEAKHDDVS